MPLSHVAVLALLQGLTETLPVSRSGHGVVARLWLDAGAPATTLEAVLHLGVAVAFLAVAHRRLLGALGEGVRAVARPTLFRGSPSAHDALVLAVGAAVSMVAAALTFPRVDMWSESPTATGVGLCVTGLALASTAMIPRSGGRRIVAAPTLAGSVVVGLAHGLASFPGASRVGAVLTVLLWMGVRADRAVDLALLLTVPALLVAFARGAFGRAALDTGTVALGLVLAFVSAAVASEVLRSLAERRRLGVLSLWAIPLGLATLAYAHSLPLPS
jgi:undecaprenyl-diphosphatase